eukprot:scaffold53143_cov23-Tisochrysis_lutea.AAC.6
MAYPRPLSPGRVSAAGRPGRRGSSSRAPPPLSAGRLPFGGRSSSASRASHHQSQTTSSCRRPQRGMTCRWRARARCCSEGPSGPQVRAGRGGGSSRSAASRRTLHHARGRGRSATVWQRGSRRTFAVCASR